MANITMATGGAGATVNVEIDASGVTGTITTGETTGAETIPAGALWAELTAAGAVAPGDGVGPAVVDGTDWYAGRKERWDAKWDVAAGNYIRLPEISINGNGSRFFYTYFS